MGDFEILIHIIVTISVLGTIFLILRSYSFRNFFLKNVIKDEDKKNFYECGLKPTHQFTPNISIQYVILSLFFLLYDSELLFLIPILTNYHTFTCIDVILISLFLFLLILSL